MSDEIVTVECARCGATCPLADDGTFVCDACRQAETDAEVIPPEQPKRKAPLISDGSARDLFEAERKIYMCKMAWDGAKLTASAGKSAYDTAVGELLDLISNLENETHNLFAGIGPLYEDEDEAEDADRDLDEDIPDPEDQGDLDEEVMEPAEENSENEGLCPACGEPLEGCKCERSVL